MRKMFTCLLMSFGLAAQMPLVAYGGALTGGWTESTQQANFVVWFLQTAEEARKYQALVTQGLHLFNKLSDMQEQARLLSHIDNNELAGYLSELAGVLQQGQALSFISHASEAAFAEQFKDYGAYLSDSQNVSTTVFSDIYTNWNQSLNDTILATLNANRLTYESVATDEARLATIQARTASATSRNEFLKASNDLAAFTVEQLRRLSLIRMQHSQAHMQYLAYTNNKNALQAIKKQSYMTTGTLPILGDGASW